MLIIRTTDLNDKEIPEIFALLWKVQHALSITQIKINKNNLLVEKMAQHFSLAKNEILILKCILWSERITANGIANHLLLQKSNVLKTIKTLINKNVLRIMKDGTYNTTKEFYKKWTDFINGSKLLEIANETYFDIEQDLSSLNKLIKLIGTKLSV